MKPVREVVSREIIDDLWGAGYTILPRARHPDLFYVPAEIVPRDRAYQWMHIFQDMHHFIGQDGTYSLGWVPVPASRQPPLTLSATELRTAVGLHRRDDLGQTFEH